jgi:formate dehydrogenase gamma subunit
MLHWAIAIPFMVCWTTALVLFVAYNPDPLRPYRDLFSWIHRISGACLLIFPALVALKNRHDYRIHLYNIKTAWLWSLNDLKWLVLMGLAAISKKIVLPEQGKFNAAEKVNFMSVMVASPLFIVSGIMIWLQETAWAAWLLHAALAVIVSPAMLGHIYMATVNPDTRIGLKGMITGYVDRQWAKHHYGAWYREHFERTVQNGKAMDGIAEAPDLRIHIHCPSCSKNLSVSWAWLLQRVFANRPLQCPGCRSIFAAIETLTDEQHLEWIKQQIERRTREVHSAA